MSQGKQRGSGLIEFALGFSVLMVVLVGLVQVSVTMMLLNQLSSAVRTGARYAASVEFDEPGHRFVESVKNVVAYGVPNPESGAEAVVPGLLPENVQVSWTRDAAGAPELVTVALDGFSLPTFSGERKLNQHPRMTLPHRGPWTPATGSLRQWTGPSIDAKLPH